MSVIDTTVTVEGTSVVVDSTTGTISPAAALPAKPAAPAADEPAWLPARLERERAKVLKDLGAESLDDAKKAVEKSKAVDEAQKSDAQKRGELETTLKAERAEKQELSAALASYAKSQMGTLTDAQRNAVSALAGDDHAKQLKAIDALRSTWTGAAATAAIPVSTASKDTAPAAGAPKEVTPGAPPDVKAVHAQLKATNPIVAARFALDNGLFDK